MKETRRFIIILVFVASVMLSGSVQASRVKKVVLLPLDSRPCNYQFPYMLAEDTEFEVVRPEIELMGEKRVPADVEALWEWLLEECGDADYLILSIDMLLYGGLVPSRIHEYCVEELQARLEILDEIKEMNKELEIYAFSVVMRNPTDAGGDMEPEYYKEWGREIFLRGELLHKKELGIITDEELEVLQRVSDKLPESYFADYVNRRAVNKAINLATIDKVADGTLAFLVMGQDDTATYGLAAKDCIEIRRYIERSDRVLDVYMYADTDAVCNTLLARVVNRDKGKKPMIYIKYPNSDVPQIIPRYEDRKLEDTIKYQVLAAGGLIADCAVDSDMILLINVVGDKVNEIPLAEGEDDYASCVELIEYASYVIETLEKPCIIADINYVNAGDPHIIKMMRTKDILFDVAGYAGWNTASNTLGTCIPQGMLYSIYGKTKSHLNFLALRYVEDVGYCYEVRRELVEGGLRDKKHTCANTGESRGVLAECVRQQLEYYIENNLSHSSYKVIIEDCYMPWKRLLEVGLQVRVIEE